MNAGSSVASFSADAERLSVVERDRNELVFEQARVDGCDRASMGLERISVELLAREFPFLRDFLRGDPLAHDRPAGGKLLIEARPAFDAEVRSHRHARHRLHTRRDDDVEVACLNRSGRVERCLQRRATLPVDSRRSDGLGPTRDEGGDAADVERLLPDLRHTTHLHVLDLCGVEPDLADQAVEHVSCEVVSPNCRQRAVAPANGGPNGVDDECVTHERSVDDRSAHPPTVFGRACVHLESII